MISAVQKKDLAAHRIRVASDLFSISFVVFLKPLQFIVKVHSCCDRPAGPSVILQQYLTPPPNQAAWLDWGADNKGFPSLLSPSESRFKVRNDYGNVSSGNCIGL